MLLRRGAWPLCARGGVLSQVRVELPAEVVGLCRTMGLLLRFLENVDRHEGRDGWSRRHEGRRHTTAGIRSWYKSRRCVLWREGLRLDESGRRLRRVRWRRLCRQRRLLLQELTGRIVTHHLLLLHLLVFSLVASLVSAGIVLAAIVRALSSRARAAVISCVVRTVTAAVVLPMCAVALATSLIRVVVVVASVPIVVEVACLEVDSREASL